MARLQEATIHGQDVALRFADGREPFRLSLLWLRDHCACTTCQHPQTRQRLVDTFRIPAGVEGASARVEDGGHALVLEWTGEPHVSRYEAAFFASLRAAPDVLPVDRRTWDRDGIASELPQVAHGKFMATESVLKDFLEQVERYGFCFVEGVPCTPEATRAVAERVSYIRETIFGGYWDFTANFEHKDTAYTSMAIGPHTDGTYSLDAPGYQMFHCLAAECTGGENVLIDGFRIAELMQREHPDDFRILTEVEVPGQYLDHERGIQLMARRPMFRLDETGTLRQLSYNNHDRAPFFLPPERQADFYRALARFAAYCAEPALQYRRRLLPGSVLLFDNWRVLHARDAYTGYRRLAGVYLNKEDVESRLRVLRIRVGEAA
jgi:trimethyllysine dioxygenase